MITSPVKLARSRLPLALAFVVIALTLISSGAVSLYRHRAVHAEVRTITEDALLSVRLIDRMHLDLERYHSLVEGRMGDQSPDARAATEKEILALDEDYAHNAREYEALQFFPGEREQWLRFQKDVAAIRNLPLMWGYPMRGSSSTSMHARRPQRKEESIPCSGPSWSSRACWCCWEFS
jgi:hypothetical protein